MDSNTHAESGEPTDWEQLAIRLLHWAHFVMLGVRIRGSPVRVTNHGLPAIRGYSAEDFVYEAICEAFTKGLEPNNKTMMWLRDEIKRLVYQNARRKENQTLHPDTIEELSANGGAVHFADNGKIPSDATVETEETNRLLEYIKTSNDEELIRYVQYVFEGLKKPQEFAVAMSIRVEHANYLKKKLRKFYVGYASYCPEKSGLVSHLT